MMSNDTRLQAALTSNMNTKEMILSDQVKTSKVGALQTYNISIYIKSCCQRDLQNKDVSKCCQRKCSRTHDYTRCTPALHTDHSEIFSSSPASLITGTATSKMIYLLLRTTSCAAYQPCTQIKSALPCFDLTHHIMWRSSTLISQPSSFASKFCAILFQRLQLWSLRDSPTHMAVQGQDDGNTPFGS